MIFGLCLAMACKTLYSVQMMLWAVIDEGCRIPALVLYLRKCTRTLYNYEYERSRLRIFLKFEVTSEGLCHLGENPFENSTSIPNTHKSHSSPL